MISSQKSPRIIIIIFLLLLLCESKTIIVTMSVSRTFDVVAHSLYLCVAFEEIIFVCRLLHCPGILSSIRSD